MVQGAGCQRLPALVFPRGLQATLMGLLRAWPTVLGPEATVSQQSLGGEPLRRDLSWAPGSGPGVLGAWPRSAAFTFIWKHWATCQHRGL